MAKITLNDIMATLTQISDEIAKTNKRVLVLEKQVMKAKVPAPASARVSTSKAKPAQKKGASKVEYELKATANGDGCVLMPVTRSTSKKAPKGKGANKADQNAQKRLAYKQDKRSRNMLTSKENKIVASQMRAKGLNPADAKAWAKAKAAYIKANPLV